MSARNLVNGAKTIADDIAAQQPSPVVLTDGEIAAVVVSRLGSNLFVPADAFKMHFENG